MEEKKQKIVQLLGKTSLAILNDDITTMIKCCTEIGLSSRIGSPILDLCEDMIIEKLSTHLLNSGADNLIITRKGAYGEDRNDYYTIVDGILQRNRKPAKWSSVGTLYQAYKAVCENTFVEDNITE